MDVLRLLERGDRADISGNRLTSYSFGLGGGALNYWNGENIGGQLALAFEDLVIELAQPDGGPCFHRLLYLSWRPDRIKGWHVAGRELDIIERKTIWNDVFVSELTFCYCNKHAAGRRPIEFDVVMRGYARENHEMRFDDGVLHIDERGNRTHRIIGLGKGGYLEADEVSSPGFRLKTRVKFEGYSTEVEHEERTKVYVISSSGDSYEEALEKFKEVAGDPEQAFVKRTAEWKEYFDKCVPTFSCDDTLFEKQFYHSYFVAFANLYDFGRGFFQRPFSSLGKYRLLPQWYWDTGFHSLYEKWLNGTALPKSGIKNLLLWREVADEVREELKERGLAEQKHVPEDDQLPFTLDINSFVFGKLVDPNVIPCVVWDIYLKDGDLDFVKSVYEPLRKFDRWLEENRDLNGENLINLVHQGESGWDNSYRFLPNKILKYAASPMTNEGKTMQSPDFNTYFYLSRLVLAKFAELLGDEKAAAEFREKAKKTLEAIETLWDEDLGLYIDRYEADHTPHKVKTPGGMIPMLGAIPDRDKTKRMISRLTNPKEFWSPYPVPTLSMDHAVFNAEDEYQSYWNGRMWPQINWVLIEGLVRYGYHDIAREIALKTLESFVKFGPSAGENYDPIEGGPYRKHSTNTFNYGWGGLGADILIRRVLGLQGYATRDMLILDPLFPPRWDHAELGNITIGEHQVAINYSRSRDRLRCTVTHCGPKPLKVVTSEEEREISDGTASFEIREGAHVGKHWLDFLTE